MEMNITEVLQIISLCLGIIGGVYGFVLGVIAFVKAQKGKSAQEVLTTLKEIATNAMTAAEKSGLSGADKKVQVLDAVQAGASAAGIVFTDELKAQISAFIDQSIAFANAIKKSK